MTIPTPVGLVHYGEPRAIQIRNPESIREVHSAVHSNVAIYTDTKTDTNKLLAGWEEIMRVANLKAQEILGRE